MASPEINSCIYSQLRASLVAQSWKGLPWCLSSKESVCNVGDPCSAETGVWSWVEKIPWRRKWHPTPVFLHELKVQKEWNGDYQRVVGGGKGGGWSKGANLQLYDETNSGDLMYRMVILVSNTVLYTWKLLRE